MPPPPPMHENFPCQNFRNTEGFRYEFFRQCVTKIVPRKSVIPVPFLSCFLSYQNVLQRQGSPVNDFSVLSDKKIDKTVMPPPPPPPPMHENPHYHKFFETERGSVLNFFGTLIQKSFDGKT